MDVKIPIQSVKNTNPTKMTVNAMNSVIRMQLVITVRRKTVPDSKDLSIIIERLPIDLPACLCGRVNISFLSELKLKLHMLLQCTQYKLQRSTCFCLVDLSIMAPPGSRRNWFRWIQSLFRVSLRWSLQEIRAMVGCSLDL